jgi:ABC-type lipoprotein export system ATPase subunit
MYLKGIDLSSKSRYVALMGTSGSGKSTLMNCGFEQFSTSGTTTLTGKDVVK